MIRRYIEDELVAKDDGSSPWLGDAWAHLATSGIPFESRAGVYVPNGKVGVHCGGENGIPGCTAVSFEIANRLLILPDDNPSKKATFLHELAHVYTLSMGVATQPVPLGLASLYFVRSCNEVAEPLADIVASASDSSVLDELNWWTRTCSTRGGNREEALVIVRSALAGKIPQWFVDTYHDDQGQPDLDRVWADLHSFGIGASSGTIGWNSIVYQLRNAYGGYCDSVIGRGGFRDTINPWRDGGCVPGAPQVLSAVPGGSGRLIASWASTGRKGCFADHRLPTAMEIGDGELQPLGRGEYNERRRRCYTHHLRPRRQHRVHHPGAGLQPRRRWGLVVRNQSDPATTDSTPPLLESATVDTTTLTLTWNEALNATAVPGVSAFSVMVANQSRAVTGVSVSGSVTTLTLASAVDRGDAVTVSYVPPASGPDRDPGCRRQRSGGVHRRDGSQPDPASGIDLRRFRNCDRRLGRLELHADADRFDSRGT